MTVLRRMSVVAAVLVLVLGAGVALSAAQSRTVGQTLDDTVITAEIKAKLAAEKLSNLTKIGVDTKRGMVTLSGSVDTLERRERATQIAAAVKGVVGVVNTIEVAGGSTSGTTASTPSPVDATGVVARVDPAAGTITLQDGRILKMTNGTAIWQPTTLDSLRPGAQVLVRGAVPLGLGRDVVTTTPEWRMGTVRSVDASTAQVVLTDGTVVRVAPSAYIHRGPDRLMLEQVAPGSEVVIRPLPAGVGSGEGSAAPGQRATAPTLDAAEINVVWAPSAVLR